MVDVCTASDNVAKRRQGCG